MKRMLVALHRLIKQFAFILPVAVIGLLVVFEPALAQSAGTQSGGVGLIIARILQVTLGIAMLVLLGFLVYGGFIIATAEGEEIKEIKGKKYVTVAGISFLIVAVLFGIVTFLISRYNRQQAAEQVVPTNQLGGGLGGFPTSLLESHYPENLQKNLSRNTSIIITFVDPMDVNSIVDDGGTPENTTDDLLKTSNIRIYQEGSDPQAGPFVAARVQYTEDKRIFFMTPINLLGNEFENTNYQVDIGGAVQSEDGFSSFEELGGYSWTFEVGTFIDLTPPHIESVFPLADSDNPRNVVLQINFNEAMNPLTVIGSMERGFDNILVKDSLGEFVNGRFSLSNQYKSVEFLTNSECGLNACGQEIYCFEGDQQYSVELRAASVSLQPPTALFPFDGITDASANSFDGNVDGSAAGSPEDDFQFFFTTNDSIQKTPAKITAVEPGTFQSNVSLDSPVSAIFDQPLWFSTLNRQSAFIRNLSYTINSTNEEGRSKVEFVHEGLEEDTSYTPVFSSDLRDLYQNCYRPCVGP